ncbi:putative protein binding protein [Cucumis melo var. makuwa]|uniref:Uncharacterized protein n=1 Tax=Cucumis melo var. makuwa TaxID=1194695 RepID=A0A5A7TQQ5_CUCMM|nr:putative protein binding protein [Cucumis melo var. makuwa]
MDEKKERRRFADGEKEYKTMEQAWVVGQGGTGSDTLVRQAVMVVKCVLLMNYKNSRGRNYCKQGQMLTLVEYLLLLYRALLPTPVWYRFFLSKEYGSLFSSLLTGLYLTFKLTSVVEKVEVASLIERDLCG